MPSVNPDDPVADRVEPFIARWSAAEAAERANYQLFLTELCDLLEVPHPDPAGADNDNNAYVFDRAITRHKPDGTSTTVYADLYKRGAFILETKQGAHAKSDSTGQELLLDLGATESGSRKSGHGVRGSRHWDLVLERAYNQARGYIRDLPASEGRPPFLIVCDVGYVIELYSEFTRTGGSYIRFPDPQHHRIYLEDLRDPATRERLRTVWTDPLALDPSRHAARVTREVADHLAALAKSLEVDDHDAESIATFLQRCLFTMFAEDVGLLPENAFVEKLRQLREHPEGFVITMNGLWKDMASEDEWSLALMDKVAWFNGGLFESATALPLRAEQIAILVEAARSDWSDVEPAIFGTLLERALTPAARHKLGAHYTPRSYVERLVKPTVIDPLRSEWEAVKGSAFRLRSDGRPDKAIEAVREFHHQLCRIRVLDPACGSGNFLYVTLEHMKRLEGEVLELLEALGDSELTFEMDHYKVRPQQFLGLEINERAVAIAQLVLWIGYFQWHKKTTGEADTRDRPLLPKQETIVRQDAVLAYDERTPRRDENGNFVTIWDGRTTRPHPVTGNEVPDEAAQIPVFDYSNPRRAEWPEADFVVGNPPFIGKGRMREFLGDGYTESLRQAWKGDVPDSADFVMYWWEKAAELLCGGKIERFGFITTNSVHQTFNRRVLERHLGDAKTPLTLAYAIPDHPWVDSADGAAVRIAMTVATRDAVLGELNRVTGETRIGEGESDVSLQSSIGPIAASLKTGAAVSSSVALRSNSGLSCLGLILGGKGFKVSKDEADLINESGLSPIAAPIWNGSDITSRWAGHYAIDAFGLSESELRDRYPQAWQHLKSTVFPIRQTNRDRKLRENWWLFRRANTEFRTSTDGLRRFIVTSETAKHRVFSFLESPDRPEHKLVVVAHTEAGVLATLSSSIHVAWALNCGSRLGVGNDPVYVKTRCFETFPFPDLAERPELRNRLAELGEQLDAHRKRQQAAHPELTMTGMYNVLEKLRRGEALTEKERAIHDAGLVSVLKQLHDEIDGAVLDAYGWSDLQPPGAAPLGDRLARGDEPAEALEQDLLTRLVGLNHERAAEEARGRIRWLRPEYQNPEGAGTQQAEILEDEAPTIAPAAQQNPWPKELKEQFALLKSLISTHGPEPEALLAQLKGRTTAKRRRDVTAVLATLEAMGQV